MVESTVIYYTSNITRIINTNYIKCSLTHILYILVYTYEREILIVCLKKENKRVEA